MRQQTVTGDTKPVLYLFLAAYAAANLGKVIRDAYRHFLSCLCGSKPVISACLASIHVS